MPDIVKYHAISTAPAFQIQFIYVMKSQVFHNTTFLQSESRRGEENGDMNEHAFEKCIPTTTYIVYAQPSYLAT